jgi:hypothetical protein
MQRMIAFLFSLSVAATLWSPDRAPAGQAAASGITAQTSSMTRPLGALVELSPTLQPPVIGSFFFEFGGQNFSVITPDGKYMYVLVATGTENQPTDGPNKILTYIVNADGTLTPITSPQAGQDIVSASTADLATGLFAECSEIAAKQGFPPRPEFAERTRTTLTTPPSLLTSSMLRDSERGAPVEADHILGDLLRFAGPAADKPLLRLAYSHTKVYEARRARTGAAPRIFAHHRG